MARRKTLEEFKADLFRVWGSRYTVAPNSVYVNGQTKIKLICHCKDKDGNEHGEFYQYPSALLRGVGCQKCSSELKSTNMTLSNREIYDKCIKNSNGYYDYSFVLEEGKNDKDEIKVICPKHGVFLQNLYHHLSGEGCPKCALEKAHDNYVLSVSDVIDRFNKKHNFKYDYSMINNHPEYYRNMQTKVPIICHCKDSSGKEHGIFWQEPNVHLKGHGCPICNESHAEKEIRQLLDSNRIEYIFQANKKTLDFLDKGNGQSMSLDFYLSEYRIGIECQGIQHFQIIDYYGGKEAFKSQIERDKLKYQLCKDNGIKILYFSILNDDKLPKDYIDRIYTNKDELIETIENNGKICI